MKNIKPYFLRKIKSKKLKCRLLQFLFGALRVNNSTFSLVRPELKLYFLTWLEINNYETQDIFHF